MIITTNKIAAMKGKTSNNKRLHNKNLQNINLETKIMHCLESKKTTVEAFNQIYGPELKGGSVELYFHFIYALKAVERDKPCCLSKLSSDNHDN
jgi:hypothetical protein